METFWVVVAYMVFSSIPLLGLYLLARLWHEAGRAAEPGSFLR